MSTKRKASPVRFTPLKRHIQYNQHQNFMAEFDFGGTERLPHEVVFREHTKRLVELINSHAPNLEPHGKKKFIVMAMAWLTNFDILKALGRAKRRGVFVAVVTQKEDFLRPDNEDHTQEEWRAQLRKLYDALGSYCGITVNNLIASYASPALPDFRGPVYEGDQDDHIGSVRCVGNNNSCKSPSFPRMHHKFVVFGSETGGRWHEEKMEPEFVWTGSFNASNASEKSFENAVILHSREISMRFFQEFCLMYMVSEPLDWTSEWMAPTLEFGT